MRFRYGRPRSKSVRHVKFDIRNGMLENKKIVVSLYGGRCQIEQTTMTLTVPEKFFGDLF